MWFIVGFRFLHFKRADLVDVGFDSFEVNEVGLRVV